LSPQDLIAAALKLRSALVAVAAPAATAAAAADAAKLGESGSSMLGVVKLLEVFVAVRASVWFPTRDVYFN
jgi:hypothetical protein